MLQKKKGKQNDFYILQKANAFVCVICLKCKSCILILGHFSLQYLTLYPKKISVGGLWNRRIFYSSSDPYIYKLSIYTVKRTKTHTQKETTETWLRGAHQNCTMSEESTNKKVNMLRGKKTSHNWW